MESAAAADEGDRDGDRGGGDGQHAQRTGAELIMDAARWEQRQPEICFDHALLRGQAVDRDDLGGAEAARGTPVIECRPVGFRHAA